MRQSQQDDVFEDLECFAQLVYLNLVRAAIKRTLSDDEAYLLQRAAELAGSNGSERQGIIHTG
jgi:hypothetical protein